HLYLPPFPTRRSSDLREAPDGGHRLRELVVQLVRDQAALLLHALLDEQRQLAALLEPRARIACLALRLHLVLHRLRHAVEDKMRSEEHTSELQSRFEI